MFAGSKMGWVALANALLLSMLLAACGGGGKGIGGDAGAPASDNISYPQVSSSSSSAESADPVTKTWAFDAAFETLPTGTGTSLFAAGFTASASNDVQKLSALVTGSPANAELLDVTRGSQVKVDGLIFDSIASGVIRYRAIGFLSAGVPITSGFISSNGSFYSANAPVFGAVGTSVLGAAFNVRAVLAVAIPSPSRPFTVTVTYSQNSTTVGAGGAIALLDDSGTILVKQTVPFGATGQTITYTAPDSHGLTNIKVFYSREGLGNGGVSITQIVRTQ